MRFTFLGSGCVGFVTGASCLSDLKALADLGIAYQGVSRCSELINLFVDLMSDNVLMLDA